MCEASCVVANIANSQPVMRIMEYGSTPYIGMAPKKNGCPIACVESDMFKTLP